MKSLEVLILCAFAIAACWAEYEDDKLLANHKIKRVVCNSQVCQERAKLILASVNQSADPCEDFYEYVCKQWVDAHPIPEGLDSISNAAIIIDQVSKDLKGMVEEIKNTTHTGSLTEKLGIAYRACKSSLNRNDKEKGLKIIRDLLAKNGLAMWPLIGNATGRPFKDSMEVLSAAEGLSLIFSFGIVNDLSDGKSKIIQLQQSTDSLKDDATEKPAPKESNDTMTKATDELKSFMSMFTANATDEQLASFARDHLKFKKALAELVQPLEERRNLSRNLAKRTIKEVEANLPGLPLLHLLNKEFNEANVTLHGSDKVLINPVDYVNRTVQFIKKTDPVLVYNYIGAQAARKLAALTWVPRGKPLGTSKNDSQNIKDEDVTNACLVALQAYMPELLARLYLQHKFSDKTRDEVRAMLSKVGSTYYTTLRTVPWMDIVTRRRAIDKLWKMAPYVGYSGFNLSDEALNKYFDQVGEITSNDSFTEIILKFDKNSGLKEYASLRQDGPLWLPQGGPEVNAFNLISFNTIVISAGILRGVFYQPGLPSFINLAGIGAVMGHEISHAYDDQGSEYDAIGRVINWWTNFTRQEYERRRDCFTRQYGGIFDPVANMSLNGLTTIGENIADNAGIRAAYYTHQTIVPDFEETTLPGLENFNRDQLFFISYALLWCENARPSHIVGKITKNVHSPNKYRVNVPLKNLEQFSAAFNCKAGSGMRLPYAERCRLW